MYSFNKDNDEISFGSVMIYALAQEGAQLPLYQGAVLVNATSWATAGAFGAQTHVAFLRHFLNAPDLKLTMTNRPFPLTA